nr:regucalcin isoform X1 [Drosophila suzukii]
MFKPSLLIPVLIACIFGLTMSYKVEPLPDSYAGLGEGPHWDVARQSLYYVDLEAGSLLRYDFAQNKVYKTKIEGETLAGFVLPVEGRPNEFAVGCGRRVVIVNWDGVSPTAKVVSTLFEVQPLMDKNRLNDAKVDPRGRFFGGTMRYIGDEFEFRHGELYRWEAGGQVSVIKGDVGISNGLAWDEKAKKFYYIDTTDYEVKSYDYDFNTGVATNPKVIFNLRKNSPKDHLLPDGLTIDTEGNLYVATFNGATIFKINPNTGKVLLEIKFPTKQITSAAFGGPNLDILFVTTAAKFDQPAPAGTTYKVTGLNATGYPGVNLKV